MTLFLQKGRYFDRKGVILTDMTLLPVLVGRWKNWISQLPLSIWPWK